MGKRERYLAEARTLIGRHCGPVCRESSIYETEAWGQTDQPSFLNQVLAIATALGPTQLIRELLDIEKRIGRVRSEKYGPRTIDIDILLFNNEIINTPLLQVPHPRMASRRFVLAPLAEIAPELIHPALHKTITQLLAECPDTLRVKKYS